MCPRAVYVPHARCVVRFVFHDMYDIHVCARKRSLRVYGDFHKLIVFGADFRGKDEQIWQL